MSGTEFQVARLERAGIDVDEPVVLLSPAAAGLVERIVGKRPAFGSLDRWHRSGARGVHLEVLVVGRTRFVTARALVEFFHESGRAKRTKPTPAQQNPRRRGRRRPTRT